jgi:hypothetical protein
MEMEQIRRWVDRIPVHIEAIIDCEGGNEYMEGSAGVSFRTRWKRGATLVADEEEERAPLVADKEEERE